MKYEDKLNQVYTTIQKDETGTIITTNNNYIFSSNIQLDTKDQKKMFVLSRPILQHVQGVMLLELAGLAPW